MPNQVDALAPSKVHEVVCYLSRIQNWEAEADRAEKYVGRDVRDWSAVRIFITGRHAFVYAHSNFIVEGCNHPTKLLSNGRHDLLTLTKNLVASDEQFSKRGTFSEFEKSYATKFTFYIDEIILKGSFDYLKFDDLNNCFVLTSVSSEPVPMEAYKSATKKNAPVTQSNPWLSGSFYLFAFLSVVAIFRWFWGDLHPIFVPILLVGGMLVTAVVGALTLRNQKLLHDKPFIELITLAFRQMPLLGNLWRARVKSREDSVGKQSDNG